MKKVIWMVIFLGLIMMLGKKDIQAAVKAEEVVSSGKICL